MSSSLCSTVNPLPRIISISTGRMAPLIRPAPFVMPMICSPLPPPFLAYNAQRTLSRSSLWFLTSRLPYRNSGLSIMQVSCNRRTTRSFFRYMLRDGYPTKSLFATVEPSKAWAYCTVPNQPQRFHLPSAHETEAHSYHPCPVHQASVPTRHQSGGGQMSICPRRICRCALLVVSQSV